MADRRNWRHDQLLAALYVYAVEPFGRLHQSNPLIIRVADQIGRTPSALAMKACNFASFDPAHTERGVKGLSNASRADRDLWNEFVENSEAVAAEAAEIVGETDEVEAENRLTSFKGDTEVRRDVVVRRAQSFFRKAVLISYDGRCALSGIAIAELLNASHIVPWRSAVEHRADPRNGIALNTLYDRAFDRGLFTFDDDYRVRISPALKAGIPLMDINGEILRVPKRWRPLPEFLAYHREHVFQG